MTSIRKSILVSGNPHFVEVNSSLDLEEVEITGTDPATGKTVHVSLSSLLKSPSQPSPYSPQPVQGGYASPSQTPSLLDLNMPSPSSLSAGAPSMSNYSSPSSSPAPMDMFSEPSPNITPPLSNEMTVVPAAPTGLMGLAGLSQTPSAPVSQAPDAPAPEVIQSREPQGLEALDDELPSMALENSSDDIVVESTHVLRPSLKRPEPDLDDTLSSMYRH